MYQQQYTSHNPVNINGTVNSLLGFYFETFSKAPTPRLVVGFLKKTLFFKQDVENK